MLDLFWNLLGLAGVCFVILVLLGGAGIDIPEEAEEGYKREKDGK